MAQCRENACTGKRAYIYRRDAKKALKRHTGRKRLMIYECPYCEMFHLGGKIPMGRRVAKLKKSLKKKDASHGN